MGCIRDTGCTRLCTPHTLRTRLPPRIALGRIPVSRAKNNAFLKVARSILQKKLSGVLARAMQSTDAQQHQKSFPASGLPTKTFCIFCRSASRGPRLHARRHFCLRATGPQLSERRPGGSTAVQVLHIPDHTPDKDNGVFPVCAGFHRQTAQTCERLYCFRAHARP